MATNLMTMALSHGTDKFGPVHQYAIDYEFHFQRLRYTNVKLLEIGVGGYDDPAAGGSSLRMWKEYFAFGEIHGLDIHDKTALAEKRIHIHRGDQGDAEFLRRLIDEIGVPDIVIDDGSHRQSDVLTSFMTIFPLMRTGGVYCVEDLATAYLDEPDEPCRFPQVLKDRIDGLHWQFIGDRHLKGRLWNEGRPEIARWLDRNIGSIHLSRELAILYRGPNPRLEPIGQNQS